MVSSAHPRQSGTAAASAGGWLGEQCAGGRTSLALVRVLRRARAGVVATVPLSIPGAILSEEGSNVFGLLVKRGQGSEHQVVSLSRSVGWRPELKDIRLEYPGLCS